jgi:hypothetical protein
LISRWTFSKRSWPSEESVGRMFAFINYERNCWCRWGEIHYLINSSHFSG